MQQLPKTLLDKEFIASLIKPRHPQSHKGDHGHALLIAGNTGRMGAALLSARACLRTGTGLLTVNVPSVERMILQTALPEAMLIMREHPGPIAKYTACGVGPALGLQEENMEMLSDVLQNAKPMVLDADALTLLANHKNSLENLPAGTILTPHPKEFDRLFGESKNSEDRYIKAVRISATQTFVVVLKGYQTAILANGTAYTNTSGNAGLAKGGSGDVLTGMILSLLTQGYQPLNAACIAVYLHGLAADIALEKQSLESLLASDVIEHIGDAFNAVHS